MSDILKHECGLAVIRLLKPLSYYQQKYGTPLYGIHKLELLLQKQRNRGQDGAGMATIKLDLEPGMKYIDRYRSNSQKYIKDLFDQVYKNFDGLTAEQLADTKWLRHNVPFAGELLLGHLRYGADDNDTIEAVHPFLRLNNWITRNLVLAGNFNLTNTHEMFEELLSYGQYPKEKSSAVTVLEKIGHFLDDEVQKLYNWFKQEGYSSREINHLIADHLDIQRLLQRSCRKFDGGYVIAGLIGHGDAFVLRDPLGIRPAYYYHDDEVVVVASERPTIQTSFKVKYYKVKELKPGHALIIKKDGTVSEEMYKEPVKQMSCSFERIYFSRGNDRGIYLERKRLGELLVDKVLGEVDYDLDNTIFSFIPNTAEVAFYGMIKGLETKLNEIKKERILALNQKNELTEQELGRILAMSVRAEKLAVKDEKLRTFIADNLVRSEMVSHVYDVTYGIVRDKVDTIVLIDDSIVRGVTLKDSIISILGTLIPKKIVIVSSAPQVRYPDCYGIDMTKMDEFVAFRALIDLIKDTDQKGKLIDVYNKCKKVDDDSSIENYVKLLYSLFTEEEITDKISELVTPENLGVEVKVIFQSIENLNSACPGNLGDWYFSGNYPTAGGMRMVNRSFVDYIESNKELIK